MRIVADVGGKESVVRAAGPLKITSAKPWRIEFEGPPATAAGIRFQAKGSIEQDGLVDLALTFAPEGAAVKLDGLRVEWPVDDALGLSMACIGQGGNVLRGPSAACPAAKERSGTRSRTSG